MKNKVFFASTIIFLYAATNVFAQQNPLIQNAEARKSMSLDGLWQVVIDPLENGFYSHRYTPKEDGFFINQKMESPSDLIEYNFDEGPQLYVPGDWNTQNDKLYYYESTVWYKRDFDYNKTAGNKVYVYFGAVNYDAVVYLNGKKVGEHIGGYTPFNFEVTDLLQEEDNFLVLKVNNTRKREAVPTLNIDWWNYGGITRSAYLLETPSTFIQDYFIQLEQGSEKQVKGWVQMNEPVQQQVTVSIPELKIEKSFTTDAQGRAEVSFSGKFDLWSPNDPKLYDVKISSQNDEINDRIGFRTIETDGHQVILNGEPVFLKGICIHAEAPFGPGRVTSQEECEVLLGWAKELGCNFVRLAHYPHSEDMIKTAEKMGILVWSEIPVYWTVLFDNQATYENAENQLTEMITRDRNRTNIILWSVANETPVSDTRVKFLSNLAKKVKSMDDTRLTTAALDTHSAEDGYNIIDDPLGEYIDVIGINHYCGWYYAEPGYCDQVKWRSDYDKPVIISEVGGGALQGYHGEPDERWTEEYQDAVYKSNLEMMDNIDFLAGMTPWLLNDFLSPRRNLTRIQDDYNRKGLISQDGIKKKAFFRLQDYYKNKK